MDTQLMGYYIFTFIAFVFGVNLGKLIEREKYEGDDEHESESNNFSDENSKDC